MISSKPLRRRRGASPAEGTVVYAVRKAGVWWVLFERGVEGRFLRLKVAADHTPGKANYWLSWDMQTERFTRVPDAAALHQQHPAIHDAFRDVLLDLNMPLRLSKSVTMVEDLDLRDAGEECTKLIPYCVLPPRTPVLALRLDRVELSPVGDSVGDSAKPGFAACETRPPGRRRYVLPALAVG